jgi:hypothetical protein
LIAEVREIVHEFEELVGIWLARRDGGAIGGAQLARDPAAFFGFDARAVVEHELRERVGLLPCRDATYDVGPETPPAPPGGIRPQSLIAGKERASRGQLRRAVPGEVSPSWWRT